MVFFLLFFLILYVYQVVRTNTKKNHAVPNLLLAELASQAAFVIANAALVFLVTPPISVLDFFLDFFNMDGSRLFLKLGPVSALFISICIYLIDRARLSEQMPSEEKSKKSKRIIPRFYCTDCVFPRHGLVQPVFVWRSAKVMKRAFSNALLAKQMPTILPSPSIFLLS